MFFHGQNRREVCKENRCTVLAWEGHLTTSDEMKLKINLQKHHMYDNINV